MKTLTIEWIKENVIPKISSYQMPDSFILSAMIDNKDVTEELNNFLNLAQNDDGGFKAWLEPDIQSDQSTIIATSVAMKFYYYLNKIDSEVNEKLSIYLNEKFNKDEERWNIVSNDVSNDPHAFWWNKEHEASFGYVNPSATILTYAQKLGVKVSPKIIEAVTKNIDSIKEMNDVHDYACLNVHYDLLGIEYPSVVLDGAEKLMSTKIEEWNTYVPKPLDIVTSKHHPLYKKYQAEVDLHLDYLIDQLLDNGLISPTWQWGQFEEFFEKAKKMWEVRLTTNAIEMLKEFGRLK